MHRWRWAIGVLVALHLLAGARVMVATDWDRPSFTTGDHLQYRSLVEADGRPYRDKTVAFPPVSYLAFEVLEGHGDATAGGRLLVLSELVADLVVAGALLAGWGRRAAAAWLVLMLPLLWDGWVLARIDLLSVALAVGGLALVRRRAETAGGVALAASALAKVWSVALLPGLFVERQVRAARATVVALAVAGSAWVLVGGVGGVLDVAFFGRSTGWQVESTVGAVVYLLTGGPLRAEGGAWRIGTESAWMGAVLGLGHARPPSPPRGGWRRAGPIASRPTSPGWRPWARCSSSPPCCPRSTSCGCSLSPPCSPPTPWCCSWRRWRRSSPPPWPTPTTTSWPARRGGSGRRWPATPCSSPSW